MTDAFAWSAELLAAQRRLLALRGIVAGEDSIGKTAQRPSHPHPSSPIELPEHLGWDSARVTAVRQRSHQQDNSATQDSCWLDNLRPATAVTPSPCITPPSTPQSVRDQRVAIYPDVALGMLRQELAASGRIWLLLQHLDEDGRGWVRVDIARERLTRKSANLRVCGWRQLRNLLNQGENIFWERQNDRIWLRSVAKVAAALGVWRLSQRRVALPVTALTESIGTVRAHLYASWHSGRTPEDSPTASSPIARETLTQLSSLSDRTQHTYEQRAKVQKRTNFAIGAQATAVAEQEAAWQHGSATFHLVDKQGKHGKAGATYIAWQLPNNYVGPHQRLTRGRQKQINRELADLFMQGITGNGRCKIDQHFFTNVKSAVQQHVHKKDDIYWRSQYNHIWYNIANS